MEELKRFDQDHRFPVGAGHVIIRGGTGRPRGTVDRGRGVRGGRRDQRQQQEQAPDTGARRPRADRREGSKERSYDRNFPSNWGRQRDRERDREKGKSRAGRGSTGGKAASAAWGSSSRHGGPAK